MLPFIHIFGHVIPMYWLCAVVGIILAFTLATWRVKSGDFRTSQGDVACTFCMCVVGAVWGAKLFQAVGLIALNGWDITLLRGTLNSGGVFYGGLIGGFLAVLAYICKRKIDFRDITDILVPAILHFHAIGRLGCFFAGCCYGCESTWMIAINGLIPVQLMETGFNILVLAALLITRPERKRPGTLLPIYAMAYACGRFLLEFMRGDASRGSFLIFSTSQWISLLILCALTAAYIVTRRKKRTETEKVFVHCSEEYTEMAIAGE